MSVLTLSGWGQPANALTGIFSGAKSLDYADCGSASEVLELLAQEQAEVAIGWSLGGQLLLRAVAGGIFTPKRLILLATPYQFVRQVRDGHGMPADVFGMFYANYQRNSARTLNKAWELIALGDVEAQRVRAGLAVQDRERVLAQDWLRWLAELEHFSCDGLAFGHFPQTHLIHGEMDAVVSVAQATILQQKIPHSTLHRLAGCGHAPHLHAPELITRLVYADDV